ncbi:hypothetical protein [Nonomuraea sp. GTA35]|uniref:hypothetical protein n=1 Tax=Nonomuraea sp. GTA35 TaxID=1676746 RepID=UPI0035BEF3F0
MGVIRVEVRDGILYAIATDRYTMAATRHRLQESTADTEIAIGVADAAALMKVFKYTQKDDPWLTLAVGKVEAETVLDPADRPALTVTAKDGNTLVLNGREALPLASWRTYIGKAIHREQQPVNPNLALTLTLMSRWLKATRNGAWLTFSIGAGKRDTVLVRAGDHFIGIWAPITWRREFDLTDSPWCKELPPEVESGAAAQSEQKQEATR